MARINLNLFLLSTIAFGACVSLFAQTDPSVPSSHVKVLPAPLSVDEAVDYLERLSCEARGRAEQYVRRAPPQVRTDIRQGLERVLGWTPTT